MMELSETLEVLILAVVQGVAEFLPISSSGHLTVLTSLFELKDAAKELVIMLHIGTLLSILVFYRERVWRLLSVDRRVIPLIVAGTIPGTIAGLYVHKFHPGLFENPLQVGFMFVITAFMLMSLPLISPASREPVKRDYTELSIGGALVIGVMQAFAILPGISRSGSTIVAGCLVGLKRQASATFSFLLAIPITAGATFVESLDLLEHGSRTSMPVLFMGMAVAFATGIAALWLLSRWVESGKLHYFVYWLVPAGFAVIVWQLYERLREAEV